MQPKVLFQAKFWNKKVTVLFSFAIRIFKKNLLVNFFVSWPFKVKMSALLSKCKSILLLWRLYFETTFILRLGYRVTKPHSFIRISVITEDEGDKILSLSRLLQQVLPFRFVISLNPISLVYRIAYVCFVSMFPYLALFSRASPSINRL